MANQDQNRQIAGSLTYPQPDPSQIDENVPQPRQPHNLQGLLRFAMEATKEEDAPGNSQVGPMDEERKRFLENALKSMTVDVVEEMQKAVKKLEGANSVSLDSDITEYENAFDVVLEFVDNIDAANDFHKIGGFAIFKPCLNSVHAPIRAGACNLLAELCQNNPYCQNVSIENNLLIPVLDLLSTDVDEEVCSKALYAVSCIIRDNPAAYSQFVQQNGPFTLLKALEKPSDKIRTKAAFFLARLCEQCSDLRPKLIELGFIQLLVSLLSGEPQPSNEHILSLLVVLATDNPKATEECTNPRYNLKSVLEQVLRNVNGNEQYMEQEEYCRKLLKELFSGDGNGNETDR